MSIEFKCGITEITEFYIIAYTYVCICFPYQYGELNSEAQPLYNHSDSSIVLTRPLLEILHETNTTVFISLPDMCTFHPGSLSLMSKAGLEEKSGFLPCHNSQHKRLANTAKQQGLESV